MHSPFGGIDPKMRTSDADRTKVVNLLDAAYSDGRLDVTEHEERVGAALCARTFAELEPLVHDLTTEPLLIRSPLQVPTGSADFPVRIVADGPPHDNIISILSDVHRGSSYTLAARTEVITILGDVNLDLTAMSLSSYETAVTLRTIMADVCVLVPNGIRIVDDTTKILSDVRIRGLDPAPSPQEPAQVRFTGMLVLSDLNVYGPGHRKFERLQRKWSSRG